MDIRDFVRYTLFLAVLLETVDARRRPYIDDPECPRKPDLAKYRQCLKKCRSDLDCKSKKRRCLCDGVCGRSCVKPTKRCDKLTLISNGKYDILPFNTFGARARYTCGEGYILSGHPERRCQGDGLWSDRSPTCETEGKCHYPPIVPHAIHNGPEGQKTFPLGTQLTYTCGAGYDIDGFYRAMCVGEGRWVGPLMICSPRRCRHPGDIAHGHREGVAFVYPNRVTYVCSEGYELVGRPYRTCLANGRWSGTVPICRAVTCPRMGVPANGRMTGADFTYGAMVSFSCLRGFMLLGSETKRCQQDGTWSGPPATCAMVDCGLPGPFYNGYLDGQQTTFGSVIIFRCYGKTTFEGNSSSTTCQEKGDWSNPVPKCWRKCEVPRLANGTVQDHQAGLYVKHKEKLSFLCETGHVLSDETSSECLNGTWSHLPICLPAPCNSRPPSPRHGLVRFYTMKHGDKAKYTCSTGYRLDGDEYAVCLYSKWVGQPPTCEPVYCPYPGTVTHGQVLLVGIIGKYEYRPYVRRIGQNEKIEFHCEKSYTHVGPRAATCIGGVWSPPEKPRCVPGRHPSLHIFRGRRSINQNETYDNDDDIVEIDYDVGANESEESENDAWRDAYSVDSVASGDQSN